MKLRIICLLCFLICIELSFCYEYTGSEEKCRPYVPGKIHGRVGKMKPRGVYRRLRRQEYDGDKEPISNIDLASFIQQPDPQAETADEEPYEPIKGRGSKEYADYEPADEQAILSLAGDNLKDNSNGIYSENDVELQKAVANLPWFHQTNINHRPEKKSYKLVKQTLPFFSHRKMDKTKKRKSFFNFCSKSTEVTTMLPKLNEQSYKNLVRIRKRSNIERYCPLCKRKIIQRFKNRKDAKRKEGNRKILHNSRQYFQNLGGSKSYQKKNAVDKSMHLPSDISRVYQGRYRQRRRDELEQDQEEGEYELEQYYQRRGDESKQERQRRLEDLRDQNRDRRGEEFEQERLLNAERERQLQELNEVQRKIDNVDATTSSYPRLKTNMVSWNNSM